jgi:CRISPR-associated endoribonuclease Cas6
VPQIWQFDVITRQHHAYEPSPFHLHGIVSTWLDPAKPDPGQMDTGDGHHDGDKPWAASWHTVPGGMRITVRTLTDTAEQQMRRAIRRGAKAMLGPFDAAVRADPVLLNSISWDELRATQPRQRWNLEFVTPVTFRAGRRFRPTPHPRSVFDGLRACWNRWAPDPMVVDLDDYGVIDEDIRGRSVPFELKRRPGNAVVVSGFLGELAVACQDPAKRPAVSALAALAAFSGAGAWTTKGLGVTRVTPGRPSSRAPRTLP